MLGDTATRGWAVTGSTIETAALMVLDGRSSNPSHSTWSESKTQAKVEVESRLLLVPMGGGARPWVIGGRAGQSQCDKTSRTWSAHSKAAVIEGRESLLGY